MDTHPPESIRIGQETTHTKLCDVILRKRTMVMVDASPVRISVILIQHGKDSQQYKVIVYGSRSLTPVEKGYSLETV